MTLYTRCIKELTKADVIAMHKNYLEVLPINAKSEILSILCKRGYFNDASILRSLVNSSLVVIDLGECSVTDDMLNCLHVCKFLRKLDLSLRRFQDRHVTTKGLVSLFPHLKSLEFLAIPECKELNDEVVEAICENCVRLKKLYVQHSSITDHSLHILGQHLDSLSVLNILGTGITDKGIKLLVSGNLFKGLTEVNIDRCPNITPTASEILAKKCQNVKMFVYASPYKGKLRFGFRYFFPNKNNLHK